MSNYYCQTAFAFPISEQEAALVIEAAQVAEFLSDRRDDRMDAQRWSTQSKAFRALFKATTDNPYAAFLELFEDDEIPSFDTRFSTFNDGGTLMLFGTSEQFNASAVASLLTKVLTKSLPITISFAHICDKDRPGAFGGGAFRIDTDSTRWLDTSDIDDAAAIKNGP